VWKLVLPIGTNDPKFGKWSPTWEGPYKISRCVPGNAYILETLEGEEFFSALNGKYLKKYYRSVIDNCAKDRFVSNRADTKSIVFSAKIKRA